MEEKNLEMQAREMYDKYVKEHGVNPQYLKCIVRWKDDGDEGLDDIAMSKSAKDENSLFRVSGILALQDLIRYNEEDFEIVELVEMWSNLIPAPIDNKNVCEDFTEVLHCGEFVGHSANRVIKQAFWDDGNLWVVAYRFGFNWFHVHSLQEGRNWQASALRVKNHILSLNESPNIMVEIVGDVDKDMRDFYRCSFWFKPEACE